MDEASQQSSRLTPISIRRTVTWSRRSTSYNCFRLQGRGVWGDPFRPSELVVVARRVVSSLYSSPTPLVTWPPRRSTENNGQEITHLNVTPNFTSSVGGSGTVGTLLPDRRWESSSLLTTCFVTSETRPVVNWSTGLEGKRSRIGW